MRPFTLTRFKVLVLLLQLSLILTSCASKVQKYIEANEQLSSEVMAAMLSETVINGMTKEQVLLTLGEPSFIERNPDQKDTVRWIYRNTSGTDYKDAYNPESMFPQGIGYVVPLEYKCREIRVDFADEVVFRVEKIINF